MALPADFSKIFGSTATGGLTPISDVNYSKGWEFVGSNPPTKNDFSYLQNLSDQKAKWLYDNNYGRLIGSPKIFKTSGTYTPTPGATKIIVEVQGAGGGGGGAAISAAGASAGGGGTSGCYAKALITSLSANYAVQIGAGGAGGVGNNPGSGGGRTSFGSGVSAAGGYGGDNMVTGSTPFICHALSTTQPITPVAVGGNIMMINIQQQPTRAFRLSATIASSGPGGASLFGGGGGNAVTSGGTSNNGGDGTSYGSGGGGGLVAGTSALSTNGGRGADGVVIVWEYS